ncbi:McrB family protein [Clostridium butyricum]|uniref:McrB family protein n=1 Tax=Clostridium butyricum TaxID=1492 RepID=UPI002AB2D1C1|nr:AAA family ATPase [Clostridium butyricum]
MDNKTVLTDIKERNDTWNNIVDSNNDLIPRKTSDFTLFQYGSVVPHRYFNFFSNNLSENIRQVKYKSIKIYLDRKEYEGQINYYVKKQKSEVLRIKFEKRLLELLKKEFYVSYQYIVNIKDNMRKGKVIKVPDEFKEYIDFYRTEQKDIFEIKLIKSQNNESHKYDEEIYDAEDDQDEVEIITDFSVSSTVEYIYSYITNKGYTYEKSLIKNLYTSLKTKPFVILSGISGTGKSKIVELFAKALGATTENNRFKLLPVKPDWSDSTDLLGFRNIEGKFTCGEITDIAYRAMMNPEVPYFICLDEMNLARVEYYFSDILSIMETRRCNEDGEIITSVLLSETQIGRDAASISTYGDVYIPQNLYIIGTVNMDETTFPFSKKVLDRANTIEFNKVDLSYTFDDEEYTTEYQSDNDKCRVYHNNFLKSEFLKIKDCKENKEIALKTIDRLIGINKILEKYDNHFGYRVRDEIVFYMIYAMKYDLMTFDEAFDLCMVQKILPKIGGSSSDTLEMLASIFEHINDYKIQNKEYMEECELDKMSKDVFPTSWENNNDELQIHSNLRKSKYRCTNEKLISMMRRFIRDGFTTFWQ